MTALDMHMLAAVFLAAQVPPAGPPAHPLAPAHVQERVDQRDDARRLEVLEGYVRERVPGFSVAAHGPEFRIALLGAIKECRLAIRMVAR